MQKYRRKKNHFFKTIAKVVAVVIFFVGVGYFIYQSGMVKAVYAPFTFTAAGDYSYSTESKTTIEKIATTGAQFHLALGDFAYNTNPETEFCDMVKSRAGSTFPFELLTGDHENDLIGDDGYIDNFAACLPDRMNAVISPFGTYGREYYFDYQNARFILVNPGIPAGTDLYDYSIGSNHYTWLRDRIREAKSAGKWVVVGNHVNCITMGIKNCTAGTDFTNLLITEGVDLVLMGNEHNYQRSKQLTCAIPGVYNPACTAAFESRGNTYLKGYGTVFLIVGTAGSTLYTVNPADAEAGYFATYSGAGSNPTHGLAKINVATDQILVEFVGTDAGTFTDSFTINVPAETPLPTPVPLVIPAVLTGDATIKQSSPTTTYGSSTIVETDGSPIEEFLLKFAVTNIAGKQITGAKLRLYNVNASNNGGAVYTVSDTSWIENSVNWNTAPVAAASPIAAFAAVNVNTWYEVDVSSAVTGDGTVGFRVKSSSADGADYVSKEHATGNRPQLLVSVVDANAFTPAPTTSTIVPTMTSIPSPTPTVTPTPGATSEIIVPVSDDSFIAKSSPTNNYGSTATLTNDNSPVRHILLKFTVLGVAGRTVTDAKLRLYNKDPSSAGGEVYTALHSNWTETAVNWNNAPNLGTFVASIGQVTGTSTTPVVYNVNVTGAITGDGTYTFRIPMITSDEANYISKQGTAAKRPTLVLTVN